MASYVPPAPEPKETKRSLTLSDDQIDDILLGAVGDVKAKDGKPEGYRRPPTIPSVVDPPPSATREELVAASDGTTVSIPFSTIENKMDAQPSVGAARKVQQETEDASRPDSTRKVNVFTFERTNDDASESKQPSSATMEESEEDDEEMKSQDEEEDLNVVLPLAVESKEESTSIPPLDGEEESLKAEEEERDTELSPLMVRLPETPEIVADEKAVSSMAPTDDENQLSTNDEDLAKKYSKIADLGERAYAILKDLRMI